MEPLLAEDPRQIGNYLLLARIGSGGMGEVFLGRSPGGRAVAIKVIHAALANDADFRARFRREVMAARAVTGAFTAPLVDADPDAVRPWLATTFLPGMSLQDAIAGYGPWPPHAVYLLGVSLAEALVSIHRAGVVHRDLKPSNILLSPEGPRVIDFGIARAADAGTITQTGVTVGSPSYMAPEQATGGDTGPPGDVFALGAVLTYAATGAAPFGGGSIPQLVYRIVHEQPYLAAVTDPGLRGLIAGCLKKDPGHRPTAAQLLEQLAHAQAVPQGVGWLPPPIASAVAHRAGLPLPQPATVPRAQRRRFSRRNLLVGGAITAGTLAVGATAAWRWFNRPRSPVLWSFEVPDSLRVGAKVAGNMVFVTGEETFALDPRDGKVRWRGTRLWRTAYPTALDGRCFLYDGDALNGHDSSTGELLWTESVKTFARSPVPAAMNGVVCMTASPGVGEYVLYALDAANGQRRWQYEIESLINANATAHNGAFYVGSGGDLLYAVDAAGSLRWQQSADAKVMSTPTVAGGLVLVANQDYEVLAFDAATGRRRWKNANGGIERGGSDTGVTPLVADGTVYADGYDGGRSGRRALFAIDANTGKEKWRTPVQDESSGPVVAGGLAVLHDGERTLYALETSGGKRRWTYGVEISSSDRPVITNDAVYVAGADGVLGLDLATGRLRFRFDRSDIPSRLSGYMSELTMEGGNLYCSVGSKRVYALRPERA
jgi:outer membrane protein assembly factor BamB